MCQKKAAVICWLINELPLTKDGKPSSYKQYLHGSCEILSPAPHSCLPLLQTTWAGCRERRGGPPGWGGSRASKSRGKSHCLPCPPLHAHVELTEICIQLRSTRQLLAPSLHQRRLRDLPCLLHPLQLPRRCQGTRSPSRPPWRRRSATLPHPGPNPQAWGLGPPGVNRPHTYVKKASVFSN